MRALLDLIAPVRCLRCGLGGDELCALCADLVSVIEPPLCDRCGAPAVAHVGMCERCRGLEGFGRARSLVAYAEPARALTLALKRRGRPALAQTVGRLLADLAVAHGLVRGAETVTFVPAGSRALHAGFDHAELIASGVSGALGAPMRRVLVRTGDGPRQADVSFTARRRNAAGRFAARDVSGRVLLVDDVFTTGATAEACALALTDAGASSVAVVTWARTLRRSQRS
jgi:predicted amidophosphoribosyltransferase